MNMPDKNPWKGLDFYRESEVIYGRDTEIESLFEFVRHNTQVVLYGRSGIGKSSIINAGIFPLARKENMIPVSIKLIHDGSISYIDQIKEALCSKGIEAFELLPPVSKEKETLWEFFHRHQFFDKDDQRVRLLLVLDQFEEIFTLQSKEPVRREFFAELADLINDVAPNYIIQSQDDSDVSGTSSCVTGNAGEEFCLDLNNGIDNKDYLTELPLRMIFVIREDFLSHLERYTSYIPVMRDNRFALLPLSEEQAAEIIMRPIPGLVSKAVAKLIISKVVGVTEFELDDLAELEVDSSVLSLYLSQLYNAMRKEGGTEITADLVEREGSNIISRFYEESIADMSVEKQEMLEYLLLTGDGRRDNVSRTDFINSGFTEEDVCYLVEDAKLLRQFSMQNDLRLELMHDVLCPAVLARKANREVEMREEAARLEEKSWRRTRWVSILLIILCVVAGVYVYKNWDMVTRQRQRLAEMEKSVTAEVAKQMLDRRDIYGAMRLLVNAIDTTCYDSMDVINARYECLLRQALDSLLESDFRRVASQSLSTRYEQMKDLHYGQTGSLFRLSKDGRWITFHTDEDNLRIFDARTLMEVCHFPLRSKAKLSVCDFSNVFEMDDLYYASCLILQDDSVLLLSYFDTNPMNEESRDNGVNAMIAYEDTKIWGATFLLQDSLLFIRHSHGFEVLDVCDNFYGKMPQTVFSFRSADSLVCIDYAISPNENQLLAQVEDTVYLFDTHTWEIKQKYALDNHIMEEGRKMWFVANLAFSPDGRYIRMMQLEKDAQSIQAIDTHELIFSLTDEMKDYSQHVGNIYKICFIPNEDIIYGFNRETHNLECIHLKTGKKKVMAKDVDLNSFLYVLNDSVLLLLDVSMREVVLFDTKTNSCIDKRVLNSDEAIINAEVANNRLYISTYYPSVGVYQLPDFKAQEKQIDNVQMAECESEIEIPSLSEYLQQWTKCDPEWVYASCCMDASKKRILLNHYSRGHITCHYLHNGAIFYELHENQPIAESRFTKDGRHIYIKPEDGEPYLIDLLPLPELVDSCKRILGPYWKYPSEEDRNRILSNF